MPSHRVIRSVERGFLGTYTSRNTDLNGYWLFGFIILLLEEPLTIDLLHPEQVPEQPKLLNIAARLAIQKFAEQNEKHGLSLSRYKSAHLTLERLPELKIHSICGHPRAGWDLSFRMSAISDLGRRFERETTIFVAPHNPELEMQSCRRNVQNDMASLCREARGKGISWIHSFICYLGTSLVTISSKIRRWLSGKA